jgi:hypothetical protein
MFVFIEYISKRLRSFVFAYYYTIRIGLMKEIETFWYRQGISIFGKNVNTYFFTIWSCTYFHLVGKINL